MEADVRSWSRWWRYGFVAVVITGGAVAAIFLLARGRSHRRTEELRQLLPIVDGDYQKCVLGEEPPLAELARREASAWATGITTVGRARSCAEIVKSKLEPLAHLEKEDTALGSLLMPPLVSEASFGVGLCEHVRNVRQHAKEVGGDLPLPDCDLKLPKLEPTVQSHEGDRYRAHLAGDKLALDVRHVTLADTTHVLRRTTDGETWDESAPLQTNDDLHFGAGTDAVFALAFARKNEDARYHVFDGKQWHVGTLAVGDGSFEGYAKTTGGWTVVTRDDTPLVLRLDVLMDKVEQVSLTALAHRWESDAAYTALVDNAGNAAMVRVDAAADHVQVESYFVPVGGKRQQPTTLTLDGHVKDLDVSRCHAGATSYVVIGGVAALVTTDGGKTLTRIAGGELTSGGLIECDAQHLYIANEHQFTACDHKTCMTQDIAFPRGDVYLDLEMRGDRPQLFVVIPDAYAAMILEPRGPKGQLDATSLWRWTSPMFDEPLVRIDGLWFFPQSRD